MSQMRRRLVIGTSMLLIWVGNIGLAEHPTALMVMVQAGFSPAFQKIKPQIESRLNLKLQLVERSAPQIFAHLSTLQAAQTDLVIVNNDSSLNRLEEQRHLVKGSITPIVSSQIVLWCPSDRVNLRISIGETLKTMQNVVLALPPRHAPATRAIQPYLDILPPSVQIKYTSSSLESWRSAYRQQADCAVTLKSLVANESLTHYRAFPNHLAQITAAIPIASPQVAHAERVMQLLNSPLMRSKIQALGYQ